VEEDIDAFEVIGEACAVVCFLVLCVFVMYQCVIICFTVLGCDKLLNISSNTAVV